MARVLVVEDELISALVLASVLEEEGHEVRTAARGEEAISIGKAFHADLLISDWMLPDDRHGIEVAQVLQQINPALKVIICSGYPVEDLRPLAANLKGVSFFEKPCDPEEIVAAVSRELGNRNSSLASNL